MRKSILVVDDDPEICMMLRDFLEDSGYDVMTVPSGFEAFQSLRSTVPDLIFLDLMMPRMDGIMFLEQFQKSTLRSRVAVVACTGSRAWTERVAPMDIDGFLPKPFSLDILLEEIQRLVG